jgi:hypothetical protein
MKNILIVLGIFAAIIAALFLFNPAPATADDRADFKLAGEADAFQSAANIYRYSWSADTLTNTANDTLLVPPNLVSLWTYNTVLTASNVSGTTDIILILQENNASTGAVWYEVERDTLNGAGSVRLHGGSQAALGYVKGVRQRYIVDGDNTQVSVYSMTTTLKKE